MEHQKLSNEVDSLLTRAGIPLEITNQSEMDTIHKYLEELIDLDLGDSLLWELLSSLIFTWEAKLPEVKEFEQSIKELDPSCSMFTLLMNQHNLTKHDFSKEIGDESEVTKVINQEKRLTFTEIDALALRFNISRNEFF
jgi:antitoxin component HigA of HigAB toxin-antitoxin module